VQLFKQLPLRGAAAHAAVQREVLQQMGLGLQLELQRVGAPLDLTLPPELVSQQNGSGMQQALGGAAAAAVRQQPLPGDWSASKQVSQRPRDRWHCQCVFYHNALEPGSDRTAVLLLAVACLCCGQHCTARGVWCSYVGHTADAASDISRCCQQQC
jgi:hypothetical protein